MSIEIQAFQATFNFFNCNLLNYVFVLDLHPASFMLNKL